MTLRLDDDTAAELALIAQAHGTSVSETVRSAINDHIDHCRRSQTFRTRLNEIVAANQRVLDRLS